MKKGTLFIFLFMLLPAIVIGAEVTPVGATGTSQFGGATLTKCIDGSGMNPNGDGTHSTVYTDMWLTNIVGGYSGAIDQYIVLDLGAVYDISSAKIWNYNQISEEDRKVQTYEIWTSLDGVSFTQDGSLKFLAQTPNPADDTTAFAVTESMSATDIRYVKLIIKSTYGDNYSGFSEVRFDGTLINEAPTVDAGSDDGFLPSGVSYISDANATDDGNPSPLSYTWTVISGNPGDVSFSPSNTVLQPDITISAEGVYELELEADDGQLTASDTIILTVLPSDYSEITTVSATASSSVNNFWTPERVVNNEGLDTVTGVHLNNMIDIYNGGMWWAATAEPNEWITFDLGGLADLDYVYIWNSNFEGYTNRGVQTMDIEVSLDGASWTLYADDVSLTEAPGTISDFRQKIVLDPVDKQRYVRFSDLVSWGATDIVGLAEVKFSGFADIGYGEWTNSLDDSNWNDANNWSTFRSTQTIPGIPGDGGRYIVEISKVGADAPVVDEIVPDINVMFVGEWYDNIPGPNGLLTINTGGDLSVNQSMMVGRWASEASHVQINGGNLFAQYLEHDWLGDDDDGSTIQIAGGMLELGNQPQYLSGDIDIAGGTLKHLGGIGHQNYENWKLQAIGPIYPYMNRGTLNYVINTDTNDITITATYKPGIAYNLIPRGGAYNPTIDGIFLQWTPGDDAVTHRVYLGYSEADVESATVGSPEDLGTTTDANMIVRDFDLWPETTTYYWRVDTTDSGAAVHKGNVRYFTMEPWTILDQFEDYNDTNDLKTAWVQSGGAEISLVAGAGFGQAALQVDFNNLTGSYISEASIDFTDANVYGRTQDMTMANQSSLDLNFSTKDYVLAGEVVNTLGGCGTWTDWYNDGPHDYYERSQGFLNNPCGSTDFYTLYTEPPQTELITGYYNSPNFIAQGDILRIWANGYSHENVGWRIMEPNEPDDVELDRVIMPYNDGNFHLLVLDLRPYKGQEIKFQMYDVSALYWNGLALVEEVNLPDTMYVEFEDNAAEVATLPFDKDAGHPGVSGADLLRFKSTTTGLYYDLDNLWTWWPIAYSDVITANGSIDITNIEKLTIGIGDGTPGAEGTIYFDELTGHTSRCESGWGDMPGDIYPASPSNDCWVDMKDFAALADEWLNTYDMFDMADVAQDWLENDMWPIWTGSRWP